MEGATKGIILASGAANMRRLAALAILSAGPVVGQSATSIFYNLRTLFAIREALSGLNPQGDPTARFLTETELVRQARRLGVFSGSFNPLTNAHIALAREACQRLALEAVLFAVSKVTVDKETVTAAGLEDRLLLLSLYVRRRPRYGVVILNRGLYADQAQALRRLLPQVVELTFVVGFDKALQIFDPRYYADRKEGLQRLFGLASLAVAPRGGGGHQELEALLRRPENAQYRDAVRPIEMPTRYRHLSSSQVRDHVRENLPVRGQIPGEVAAFIEETRAYSRPYRLPDGEEVDQYGLRASLLDALYAARRWSETEADFRGLLQLAFQDSPAGRSLRHFLSQPTCGDSTALLQAFQGEVGGVA